MTLKTKIALIVACCTLLMLGSYYLLSLQSARNAIVNFNKRSAVTMAKLALDNDDVLLHMPRLANQHPALLPVMLAEQFNGYAFILLDGTKLISNSLPDEVQLSAEAQGNGFQFVLQQSGMPPSIISFPAAPEPIEVAGLTQPGLYWLPLAWLDLGQQQDRLASQLNNRFMQLFLLLSLLAVFLAWLGARWLLRPVHQLLQGFHALQQGHLDQRIHSERRDEMGQLFQGFNHLADGLQRLDQQYRQMSADIAHELRTPLAAVVARLEAMQDGVVSTEPAQLSQLQTDVTRISRIIDDLNLLSLTEAGQLQLTLQAADVSALLNELQQSYQAQADATAVQLIVQVEQGLTVHADATRLRQVLSNLLNNAFRYGSSGGVVKLSAQHADGCIEICVEDKGPGLSDALLAKLFQRFNHSRSQGGSGLGLAICYQLCQLMQADIAARPVAGGGLCICISLPGSAAG
ncbi:sensor histidine kinase [Rheinheimera aquimaris]|uniref:sensor histidine kinase n=2 Tax=Rheinheimera aquimaris TaxID=412437 RepID=UPI001416F209|nr:ATP-binding protein [Rheinheimera aquimaris]